MNLRLRRHIARRTASKSLARWRTECERLLCRRRYQVETPLAQLMRETYMPVPDTLFIGPWEWKDRQPRYHWYNQYGLPEWRGVYFPNVT
jgi:hypothetical protein